MVFDLSPYQAYLGQVGLLVGFVQIGPEGIGQTRLETVYCCEQFAELLLAELNRQGGAGAEILFLRGKDCPDFLLGGVCYSHFLRPVK